MRKKIVSIILLSYFFFLSLANHPAFADPPIIVTLCEFRQFWGHNT